MGTIVIAEFVSLDTVMEDPGRRGKHPAQRVEDDGAYAKLALTFERRTGTGAVLVDYRVLAEQ